MVAGWQVYGFIHGVINTDNVSIMGLTIDYGPYAFMDVFNPWHNCNHSDLEGRYAYKYEPAVIIHALLDALAPLIGAEDELGGKAVSPDWARMRPRRRSKNGPNAAKSSSRSSEMERVAEEAWRSNTAVSCTRTDKDDESKLGRPLLALMDDHKLDFHGTFRRLCSFRPSLASADSDSDAGDADLRAFVDSLLTLTPEPERLDRIKAHSDWLDWLLRYATRIESERDLWTGSGGDVDAAREKEMRAANPRFVLRQWVLEEVIQKVETDVESGKRILRIVLHGGHQVRHRPVV
ncbi:hypothetical protein C8Q80DRAFT_656772 [Daedaleopsis nitida]|nr:hypothetical protein C8Q80DRAFT_656772 [Daedaleopsis nitida]